MKKNILLASLILNCLTLEAQWFGTTNTNDLTYRDGHVVIGATSLAGSYAPTERVLQLQGAATTLSMFSTTTGGFFQLAYSGTYGTGLYSRAAQISFWTSPTVSGGLAERMRIATDGNVGIGTSSPSGALDIQTNGDLGTSAGSNKILMRISNAGTNTNYFQNNIWLSRDNSGASGWPSVRLHDGISIDGSYLSPGVNTRTWWERAPAADKQLWGTADQSYMALDAGKLGLGTVTPSTKLEIVGSDANVALKVRHATESSAWGITIRQFSDLKGSISCDGRDLQITSGWDKSLILGTSEFTANGGKVIFPGGNVGIGTSNPGSFKLAVEGKIGAREVQVTLASPWPDYVFHEDYRLTPLAEVASFIKKNKHLPDVPTAEEIQKDGHKLGEMDVLLLKKIEEFTLYLIELKKENTEMKKEILLLKQQ